tara:strand:- start:827 stop:1711 length:885 start_codon:yes stop_codon:yes gene_type:complete
VLIIGIDENQGLLYEGAGTYGGRAVWPMPIVTPAKIVFESEGELVAEKPSSERTTRLRFREDVFDPIARIRRGRFYAAGRTQPVLWQVQPHPAIPYEGAGLIDKSLETYYGNPIWHEYIRGRQEQPLVLLGVGDRFSVWTIVDLEAISTGEDLVTLKARGSLGLLPLIDFSKSPERSRARLRESLDTFADEAHRAAPASVIDRARDAASQILISFFDVSGTEAKDLGALASRLENGEKLQVAANACRIIARLHARAKPVERAKRELRDIREQDAELAIQCVGAILCEIGWAEWA